MSTRIEVRPLTRSDWPAIEALFGERGACGGCWCMAWRRPGREWENHRGSSNRRALRKLVSSGEATGTIALHGGEAIGWCSAGPRGVFLSLETKRSLKTDWDERTWSVTCFFLHKEWRGQGVATKLLRAAVDLARSSGAKRIEGYPAPLTKGFNGRLPATFAWTGLPRLFERCGFVVLPDPPGKRPIYTRKLRAAKSR